MTLSTNTPPPPLTPLTLRTSQCFAPTLSTLPSIFPLFTSLYFPKLLFTSSVYFHTHSLSPTHTHTHTHTHQPQPFYLSTLVPPMTCCVFNCVCEHPWAITPPGTIVRECLQHSLSSFVTPCFWSKQRGGSKVQTDETALLTDQHTPPGLGLECKSNSRCRKASNKRRYILTPRPLWEEHLVQGLPPSTVNHTHTHTHTHTHMHKGTSQMNVWAGISFLANRPLPTFGLGVRRVDCGTLVRSAHHLKQQGGGRTGGKSVPECCPGVPRCILDWVSFVPRSESLPQQDG